MKRDGHHSGYQYARLNREFVMIKPFNGLAMTIPRFVQKQKVSASRA